MIGYTIVSPGEGGLSERKERLAQFGCDKVYSEKRSGVSRTATRQSLGHAIRALKAGDVFVVEAIAKIGRDDIEAYKICSALLLRQVDIVAIDEDIDTRKDSAFREAVKAKLTENRVSDTQIHKAIAEIEKVAEKTLRRKIREPDLKKIIRMTDQGKPTAEIAAAIGVDETAIRRARRRMGLAVDNRFKGGKRAVLSPDVFPEIVRKIDAGSTVAQLATDYAVTEEKIIRAYRSAGAGRRKKIAPGRYEEISRRIESGESIQKIADSFGVSDATIRKIRAQYNAA